MRVLSVVGARPQFVKAAVLSPALANSGISETLVHTGQHYDFNMSDIFFRNFNLKSPDVCLGVGSAPHGRQTGAMMTQLEPVIERERPDCVLVYGDTNSTLAAALVASKLQIPVAHIEAGLRSFRIEMPEEINRIVADHTAGILFAPNERAAERLRLEAVSGSIHVVGDLMVDLARRLARGLPPRPAILDRFGLQPGKYGVVTIHRAANVELNRFSRLWEGLRRIPMPLVFPVHPRTRALAEAHARRNRSKVILCEPLPYLEMAALTARALGVYTDSGGLQKEAFVFGVPCVTLREETEWTETLQGGWNRLAGDDPDAIATPVTRPSTQRKDAFGPPDCARGITDILLRSSLGERREPPFSARCAAAKAG